jgi:hypothetical protein
MPIDNDRKATVLNSPIPSGLIFLIWLLIILAELSPQVLQRIHPAGRIWTGS